MKIVIALDSFKGSCSAQDTCTAVANGFHRGDKSLTLVEIPVSDDGEGLLSTLSDSPRFHRVSWKKQHCTAPYRPFVQTSFLILEGNQTIIEMAQSCGLELTLPEKRDVGLARGEQGAIWIYGAQKGANADILH